MFTDDPHAIANYGDKFSAVEHGDLAPIDDFKDAIAKAWERDKAKYLLPPELEVFSDRSGAEMADHFDPADIVDGADAWDTPELITWAFSHGIFDEVGGVKTSDGAIVWDESLIRDTSDDGGVWGGNLHGGIRYSVRDYSYAALTRKPDMPVTEIDDSIQYQANSTSRKAILQQALAEARRIGRVNENGNAVIHVKDTDTDVILGAKALRHGLDRRFAVNAPVTIHVGEILENSIRINEMNPREENTEASYVLVGVAKNAKNEPYIVQFVVNRHSNEVSSVDVLYAVNAKTEPAGSLSPKITGVPATLTGSDISIALLLNYVNRYFPDSLPEDVLRHFGYRQRPAGKLGDSMLFQLRGGMSNREILASVFMDAAKNEIERGKIREYQSKIEEQNAEEAKLHEVRAQLKEASFSPGKKDKAKISQLRDEATRLANRISIRDKQLLRLEASKPLMAVLEREKDLAYKRASAKWGDRVEKMRTGRSKTEMRHKVQKIAGELNRLLLNGDKEHNVKIGLQKATAEALSAINMETTDVDARLAKLQKRIDKASDPAERAKLRQTYERVEQMGVNMTQRLSALKDAYDDIKGSTDPLIANAYQPEIDQMIKDLRETVGSTPLHAMSLQQLKAVYDTYKAVLTTIRKANKAFKMERNATISGMGEDVMREIRRTGGNHPLELTGAGIIKDFGWSLLKPVYAFKMIGSDTLSELFDNVRAGEDTWAVDVSDAKSFYANARRKYHYDEWDLEKAYTFHSKTGKEFRLNLGQIMSLYAYSKRKAADEHLDKGGFVFERDSVKVVEKKKGVPLKYTVKASDAYNLSIDQLSEICGTLTSEQAKFVDEMQTYLSDVMGEKGNEVALEMYGIKLFREKNYFPLKSARQFMYEKNDVSQETRIKNSGFTKKTVPHASNPVILSDFMSVWAKHVSDMAMYHAFVLPLEDFNRVFNYRTRNDAETDLQSVKSTLQNAYGRQAEDYIKQLLTDLNGGARSDPHAGFINKSIALFKKTATFASLSVVIQQPSAIARAFAYIDPKYFKGKPGIRTWDELKKYAPVAVIKEMGYFDTNMGRSTEEYITGREYEGIKEKMSAVISDPQYRDEVLGKAPALADELAWCQIWQAAQNEIADKQGLTGEELKQAAGKRFTEVIVNTQVYDSVLSRSGIMRSNDTGAKMATAFMAEPITSLNMIADAIVKGKRGNKKFTGRAIGAVAASIILNSILVAFVYAMRNDDDDKSYAEKYAKELTESLIDGFNPGNMIPYIRDIISLAKGYDVERSDMSIASNLIKAWKNLWSSNRTPYRKVEDFAGAVASVFGLPVKNIMRDARGMYTMADTLISGERTTGRGLGEAVLQGFGRERKDSDQLYSALMSGDTKQAQRIKDRYGDERKAVYAVRDGLYDNDKRITQAAQARVDGNQSEYLRIAKEIVAEKHFTQDEVVRAINYAADKLRKGESESSAPESPDTFKIEEYYDEIMANDQAEAAVVKKTILEDKVRKGKSEDEAAKSFKSSFKTVVKNAFEDGEIDSGKAQSLLVRYGDQDDAAAKADVAGWQFARDYPDQTAEDSWFDAYYKYAADSGVPINTYMQYRDKVRSITGKGRKEARMAVIDSLQISSEQKDAIYYSEGWAASTIGDAPWH